MRYPKNQAPWSEVVNWFKTNHKQLLLGGILGIFMILAVTLFGLFVFDYVIQPHILGITMTYYYATLSTFAGLKQEILIKESIFYYIATIIIIFLGIGI
ncbi:MAG: hypothetical protein CO117_12975 [Flavobacteriaceae bacterium CG_4_9_14_3_um_filter_33_16]|nr:MAG: hypothetical protein CO117_12975 [Flavobacteriaceae bacterium CG_4_9_14_3_um_filter_33_16]